MVKKQPKKERKVVEEKQKPAKAELAVRIPINIVYNTCFVFLKLKSLFRRKIVKVLRRRLKGRLKDHPSELGRWLQNTHHHSLPPPTRLLLT